jgi:hypothetical protein
MSSPKVVSYDFVYNNPLTVHQIHSAEVDELLEQMADELVLELQNKMPSVPRNIIVAK